MPQLVIAFCKQSRVIPCSAEGAIEAGQVCSSDLVSLLDCKYQHQMEYANRFNREKSCQKAL